MFFRIAFDAAGHVVAVIALSLPVVFFAYQPVQIVVAVAAIQYDIRQDARFWTAGLFFGQTIASALLKPVLYMLTDFLHTHKDLTHLLA